MTHNRLPAYDAPPAPVSLPYRVLRLAGALAAVIALLGVSVFVGACAARKGWGGP